MPGDVINAEVYAKYLDTNQTNWSAAVTNLITSIANGTAAPNTYIDGGSVGSTGGVLDPFAGLLSKGSESGTAPKAYLNYLVFDRNYNVLDGGYVRVTEAAKESGTDVPHEKLSKQLTIKEAGYVYIYLSNDNMALGGSQVEVYFDDMKVEHIKSPVIQAEDYYPFGLTFNSYRRENSLLNGYQYNGKELQTALDLDWLDYGARMYMRDLGRWGMIDPLADSMRRFSPYNYAFDNPIRFIDPDGRMALPGDKFQSEEAAAVDFAKTYNDNSIKDNKEYGTKIYKVEDKKSGESYYTYNEPNIGKEASVSQYPNAMQDGKVVATAHTHGAYSEKYKSDVFSGADKNNADDRGINTYVSTPNGSLLQYNPNTKQTTTISTEAPSDENHGEMRLNNIDAAPLPKNEPVRGVMGAIIDNVVLPLMKGAAMIKG